jgi:hypothetical protein
MDAEDVDDANDAATNTTVEDSNKAIQESTCEGIYLLTKDISPVTICLGINPFIIRGDPIL